MSNKHMSKKEPIVNDFFPEADYEIPESSNYMSFKEGDNTFRVLSAAITGFEYWNTKKEAVRSKEDFSPRPDDVAPDKDGKPGKIQHFWAFVVWNYEAKKVQILELKQKGLMKYMQGLMKNPAWGSPKSYDIVVNKTGSGFDTEYTPVANPHSEVDPKIAEAYAAMKIDLSKLYEGEDPFAG